MLYYHANETHNLKNFNPKRSELAYNIDSRISPWNDAFPKNSTEISDSRAFCLVKTPSSA